MLQHIAYRVSRPSTNAQCRHPIRPPNRPNLLREAKWFDTEEVTIKGQMQEVPLGKYCWVCGVSLEVWPLSSKEDLTSKFHADAQFRQQVNAVRAGVERASCALLKQQDVRAHRGIGMTISARLAFVVDDVFKVHFKVPMATPGMLVKEVTLTGPDNLPMTGCLMRPEGLGQVPHFDVEFYSNTDRTLTDYILEKADLLRKGQAGDRFTHAARGFLSKRGIPSTSASAVATMPAYNALNEAAASIQQTRHAAAEADQIAAEGLEVGGDGIMRKRAMVLDGSHEVHRSGRNTIGIRSEGGSCSGSSVGECQGGPSSWGDGGGGCGGGGGLDGHQTLSREPVASGNRAEGL